jgi:hypothetical protein
VALSPIDETGDADVNGLFLQSVIRHCAALAMVLLVLHGCSASAQNSQLGDTDWAPVMAEPAYARDEGPVVLVDAAHGNFHTIDGRYAAFAKLLALDGFRVKSADTLVTPELLATARIYVIANAIHGGDDAEWSLPTPSAFSEEEIDAIVAWVAGGGSLLLIADHMPFPGATEALAERFGILFVNGFTFDASGDNGKLAFTRTAGSLANHAITEGRFAAERVSSVTSFTGQAFRYVGDVQPLMTMPDDWVVLLPSEAWEFGPDTPSISARGLIQGAVLHHGAGRVAVFGEAAMFTAQTSVRDGVARQMGMNHPDAAENPQFLLNVLHWLAGLL